MSERDDKVIPYAASDFQLDSRVENTLKTAVGHKGSINMQKYKDSCITGEFEGWGGDTVYELDDGSKWELVSYTYCYSYSYRPRAIIWRDGGRYYLEVQDMNDKKEVREVL